MNEFSNGFLLYETENKNISDMVDFIDFSKWDDGYVAFSKEEIRLKDADTSKFTYTDIIEDKGFITEIDLWHSQDEIFEERVFEREDNGFFMQHWKLYTSGPENLESLYKCYWRRAETLVRKPVGNTSIFGKEDGILHSLEVVCPEQRLHFFITAGRRKNHETENR